MRSDAFGTGSRGIPILLMLAFAGCSIHDSRIAERAQRTLIGIGEVDLETCLGAPDQHQSFGDTDILTYYATSASSISFTLPIVEGPSLSNGGYCHMTLRFDHQVATRILYSGEKNDTAAPDAFCAPIVRTCVATLDALHAEKGEAVGPAAGNGTRGMPAPASSPTSTTAGAGRP